MAINSLDEYQKVINVSWYTPEQPAESLTYVHRHNCASLYLLLTSTKGSHAYFHSHKCIRYAVLILGTSSTSSISSPMTTSSILMLLMSPSEAYDLTTTI